MPCLEETAVVDRVEDELTVLELGGALLVVGVSATLPEGSAWRVCLTPLTGEKAAVPRSSTSDEAPRRPPSVRGAPVGVVVEPAARAPAEPAPPLLPLSAPAEP
jgi:hypothetical protein